MLYQIKNFVSFTVVVHYLMNKVHNFVNFHYGVKHVFSVIFPNNVTDMDMEYVKLY